jgi:hypothetical protein
MGNEQVRECFVISPIGEEGSDIRRHADLVFRFVIGPAMEECGIKPVRSDQLDKPGKISEQMFKAIFQSDLCLAVLTKFNPNVFYELAVAHSARRPVVTLIEKGEKLPFDIHDLRCVYYDLEIESYVERTHIKRVVSYVKEFEAAGWEAPDLFADWRSSAAANVEGLEYFESSEDYSGKDWSKLLQDTTQEFDLMGTALYGWRKAANFREIAVQKAKEGCKIRILLMHPDNPLLPFVSADVLVQANNIRQNFAYFSEMARESENIEVRQLLNGTPYFFMTRSDQYGVVVQYLASQKWGTGPLFRCDRESKLYNVYRDEFDTLWDSSAPPAEAKA